MTAIAKKRLRWQCRRGLLELDVILQQFLDHGYDQLSSADKHAFENLLQEPDPVLLAWVLGQENTLNNSYNKLINIILISQN